MRLIYKTFFYKLTASGGHTSEADMRERLCIEEDTIGSFHAHTLIMGNAQRHAALKLKAIELAVKEGHRATAGAGLANGNIFPRASRAVPNI